MLGVAAIAGDEDSAVRNIDARLGSQLGLAPLEVEDVVGNVVPLFADILGVVELLVDAAGLVGELSAGGPRGSKGPGALGRMEHELLDLLAAVEALHGSAAVLTQPVDAGCANKDHELVVHGTLHDPMNLSNFLVGVGDHSSLLLENLLKALPRAATVTRPVHSAVGSMQQDDLIIGATPQQVAYFSIEFEGLEINAGPQA